MEPANYCDDVRTALRFMKDHPDLEESVFKGRKVLCFKREGAEWKEIEKRDGYYWNQNMFDGREMLDLGMLHLPVEKDEEDISQLFFTEAEAKILGFH